MKINNDNLKLKWISGIYKDLPEFPLYEDLEYYVITNLVLTGSTDLVFNNLWLAKSLNVEIEILDKVLQNQLQFGNLQIEKTTPQKTYYRIFKSNLLDESIS